MAGTVAEPKDDKGSQGGQTKVLSAQGAVVKVSTMQLSEEWRREIARGLEKGVRAADSKK